MPFVQVNVVGSLSLEKRRLISAGIAGVLEEVAGKPPSVTYIAFDERVPARWARGAEAPAFRPIAFPFTEVKAAGALTFAQKRDIVAGIGRVLDAAAAPGNPPGYIVIQEVSRQSWARAAQMLESPPDE